MLVTFLLLSYPLLQVDQGERTNGLLTQVSQELSSTESQPLPTPTPSYDRRPFSRDDESGSPFRPHNYAVRVNAFWFTSLAFSLGCALWATLMQQWARSYFQSADLPEDEYTPSQRARIHDYFSQGVKKYALSTAVEVLPALLHISFILFFVGLIDLLFNVNHTLACIMLTWVSIGLLTYTLLTASPFLLPKSPYQTPLSPILWFIKEASILLWLLLSRRGSKAISDRRDKILNGWRHARELNAIKPTSPDKKTLEVFKPAVETFNEYYELEEHLDGLLGRSHESGNHHSVGVGEDSQSQRLTGCLRAIWCYTSTIERHFQAILGQWDQPTNNPWGQLSLETWEVALRMTSDSDHFIAFRAHCVQALMVFMWRKGRWHCAVPVAVALLERQLGVPQADINKWLSTRDHLLLIVASHMLNHSLHILHKNLHKLKTGANSNLKEDLKMILDKMCDELDASDVPVELRALFADGAKVMQFFDHPSETDRSRRWAKIFRN